MSASNLLTEWARLLLASLRAAGVRDAVLSPGSRSTPFTWAALREPGLRCHAIIDERSAAFFALGQARMTGRPTLLVCTSGSAPANYYPAVVEAAASATPLLVLSADRPFELQHAAAPQTIDQTRLFGDHARAYFDLGMPDTDPAMLRALQRLAVQAVQVSRSPLPGAVQLNARARKPLEPVAGQGEETERLRAAVDRLVERGPTRSSVPTATPADEAIGALVEVCRGARRGLIVCGPAAPWQAADPSAVAALARATGFPVVAEAASQQRFAGDVGAGVAVIDGFAMLLQSERFREHHEPDLLIQLGRPPTAAGWGPYLRRWGRAERHVVWPYGWSDPWSSATAVIPGGLDATVRALTEALGDDEVPGECARDREAWAERLRDANDVAWDATDAVLEAGFSEGSVVRAVVDRLPPGAILALGNSLPIRHADTFVRAAPRELTVWSQRGANGIDGLVSGAAGATAAAGRPTTLLIGDVSFVHDLGGLGAARDLAAPLTIVILNNGGGRIFEQLPIAEIAGREADIGFEAWLTPPRVDFGAAAAAFGVGFARCTTAEELSTALDRARASGGTTVIEAVIPEGAATGPQQEILRRLETALADKQR